MIDTITLYHPDNLSFKNISNIKSLVNNETGEVQEWGYLNNLYVKNNSRGGILTGSLAKYYFGNNLQTLTISQIKDALNEISATLGFNLNEAYLYRLDIGYNIIMDEPVINYMTGLGDLARFRKTVFNNYQTVQYSTHSKSLIFYNKMQEVKFKGVDIPGDFEGLDDRILRYEIQFKRRLSKEFKFNEKITGNYLYDRDFLSAALDKWRDHYYAIRKINSTLQNIDFKKGNKNLIKSLALVGLNTLGYDEIMGMIQASKNVLQRQIFSRLKRSVRSLLDLEGQGMQDHFSELDNKISSIEIK